MSMRPHSRSLPLRVGTRGSPLALVPQASSLPPPVSAREKLPPGRTAVTLTPAERCTRTGVSRRLVVPSPSWPALLRPQEYTWPAVVTARQDSRHRAEVNWVPAGTLTEPGVLLSVVVPLPSSPSTLLPQACRNEPDAAVRHQVIDELWALVA